MNVFRWIEQELNPERSDSTGFIYDHMDSQSGRVLPIIYQPFDPAKRMHWCDRWSKRLSGKPLNRAPIPP
ncbi:MAG: hypothetical protein CVT49_13675 [candidate division Zixibacteria bacterium HGW-Zixibacteria-1]|nr:MAG: hypothetical protein CVT49_13675 [candidate division Zixibacteria bacterium HGW-Zixibacteria-1]